MRPAAGSRWSTTSTRSARSKPNGIDPDQLGTISGPYTPLGVANLAKNWYQIALSIPSVGTGIQGIGPLLHPKALTGVLAPLLRSDLLTGSTALSSAGTVSASAGRAGLVGALSVPANWASVVPAVRTVAAELPETMLDAAPAMAVLAGLAVLAARRGRSLPWIAGVALAPWTGAALAALVLARALERPLTGAPPLAPTASPAVSVLLAHGRLACLTLAVVLTAVLAWLLLAPRLRR